ncbi:hypothetical protein A3C23_03285 [Candidatus Roizmanbacteria bacterium RIFCSPHIGHO2_02_FULL_37_13b]|uniref:DUF5666 domain-containing protein n=1 Tax=Candidatus Roizmanbacteria bacterium RIFCSPLOWO2_02_FULL_36_11 TaxID=1802071 RepID=A0A1F7JGI2_9BACT|nr:MAG: hypothetical protein A3C23_03285 [Candidatus Roizmanbacteria bacterium RIFCSPHIGHO2_02_FULL_37_13b]OGK54718.1 MAG: hypothetical protein A3H78_05495 [Candidatus Roizmanbacteria bacterium RIFCSPLOWO2_02_FULL_36_11]
MKNISPLVIVAVLISAIGISFFAGMKYQQNQRGSFVRQFNNGQMGQGRELGQGQNRTAGFRPVAGEIISSDSDSITVKSQDGSSKIVILNDKTTFNKAEEGSKDDLKTGIEVAVYGSENSDGSVTAQSVQLNPMFRQRPTIPIKK